MVAQVENKKARVIVIGNEKGGAGKTTTAIHIMMALLYEGKKVSTIDIDSRQRSISKFLDNRRNFVQNKKVELPFPNHFIVNASVDDSRQKSGDEEQEKFMRCMEKAVNDSEYIVIDTPGSDTNLSRIAHSYADVIITPINDSFIDLDVIAKVDEPTLKIEKAGVYSELVWDAKKNRAIRDKGNIDWVIIRNRLSNIDARNKRRMEFALHQVVNRLGCRLAHGLTERVIYREMFLEGLSLLDIAETERMRLSHVAARQELRDLMRKLSLDQMVTLSIQDKKIFALDEANGKLSEGLQINPL